MKNLNKIFLILLLGVFTSCGSFVDGLEDSPNSPSDASINLILPTVELSTFSNYSGQLARITSVFIQTQEGKQFQFEDFAGYNISELDVNNEWGQFYNGCILECDAIISKAGDANPHYRGIAKILKAMNLGLVTDLWGDVPNSEAGKGLLGEAHYNPKFDSQESIIANIQSLLSEGITDLSNANGGTIVPGADDLAFGGKVANWITAAHILKARYAMRISKRDANASTKALDHVNAALTSGASPANDLNAVFGVNGNELNQWYAFNFTRQGYIDMGDGFVDMLTTLNDPRLSFYGSDKAKSVGPYFGQENSPAPMVTFVELKFIEAEAAFANDKARSATALNDAIKAHIKQVTGADAPPAYVAANANFDITNVTLEAIYRQKYIALFTQIEGYSDWRRTDFPVLTPNAGATRNYIPVRLPLAQNERLYNNNAPQTPLDLNVPVWWDN
ncbi:MAG: SusD/RagB family nutrient-binding outer membrane lipoprotein [Saprospiraceae bacterium]|nr:SusD/RagB family nutrient-binding outer membrane lipoprotein [Saprospiraceae bacterium]